MYKDINDFAQSNLYVMMSRPILAYYSYLNLLFYTIWTWISNNHKSLQCYIKLIYICQIIVHSFTSENVCVIFMPHQ